MTIRYAILTISDRSSQGIRPDTSGAALAAAVEQAGGSIIRTGIIPDDPDLIKNNLTELCDSGEIDIVLTTGGTGFSPRDNTPEATLAVIDRLAPGLAEAMRLESLKVTPHAMLSRAVAGIRKRTLVINFPGSPKAAIENFNVVLPVLSHAVDLLQDSPSAEAGHRKPA
jgi:molybdenum cofactor synthesis domain-containing protein